MNSSWEQTKLRSRYHFDNKRIDPLYDQVIHLGKFVPCWQDKLPEIISSSNPVTWRTRGAVGKSRPEDELAAEEYDLERTGYGADYKVTNLNWAIPKQLQYIANLFALNDAMIRIHVQHPGQVWNLHLDKLEKWAPDNLDSVMRVQIQLTDWQPGQFWMYGNYSHTMWSAGDVTTFDWQNIPHATANASHYPRVTLQVTGIKTEKTQTFLRQLRSRSPYHLEGTVCHTA
jgi:hypothetical protein